MYIQTNMYFSSYFFRKSFAILDLVAQQPPDRLYLRIDVQPDGAEHPHVGQDHQGGLGGQAHVSSQEQQYLHTRQDKGITWHEM